MRKTRAEVTGALMASVDENVHFILEALIVYSGLGLSLLPSFFSVSSDFSTLPLEKAMSLLQVG